MSIKSTSYVNRTLAEKIIQGELSLLSNEDLGEILDIIAESPESEFGSIFDNYLVHDDGPFYFDD